MSTSAPTREIGYHLRFQPLSGAGRGYCFPCDPSGHVDLDALDERGRTDYFFARTMINDQPEFVTNSAPQLWKTDGTAEGTVGGGCIEAEVWAEAREALRSKQPALHHFSLTAEEASEEGMVCGGTMDIFIDVI